MNLLNFFSKFLFKGPSTAAKKQQEELVDEATLPELLKELERVQHVSPATRKRDLELQVPASALQAAPRANWKAQVAHQSRNAVVKILTSV